MRVFIAVFALASTVACGNQTQTTGEQARAIEREVWSPYCPGRLLIDCSTEQARELRAQIERRLETGQSSDEVLRWIRRNHGEEALARPGNPAVWLVPLALFAFGAIALLLLVRRWTRRPAPARDG